MAKTIYVNGNILITSSEFKYNLEDGALYPIPEGAEVIEPTELIDGYPCLIIDDNFSGSLFNAYRASRGLSAQNRSSYYYNSDPEEIYQKYIEKKSEYLRMLEDVNQGNLKEKDAFYKLLMVNAIMILETFVRDLIVSKVASSEDCFNSYYSNIYGELKEKEQNRYNQMSAGKLERTIIKNLFDESYSCAKKINSYFQTIYGFTEAVCSGTQIGKFIQERHLIAHKNAKEKDGEYKEYSYKDASKAIIEVDKVVEKIMEEIKKIKQYDDKKEKKLPRQSRE